MAHPFIAALQSIAIIARLAWSRKEEITRKCAHTHLINSGINASRMSGRNARLARNEADVQPGFGMQIGAET